MSREFYKALVLLLAAFGGFMTWLHHQEIHVIDRAIAACVHHGTSA